MGDRIPAEQTMKRDLEVQYRCPRRSPPARILIYLMKTRPAEFTAADIAKDLDMTAREVGGLLQRIPGVTIDARRRFAHTESGNRYTFDAGEAMKHE